MAIPLTKGEGKRIYKTLAHLDSFKQSAQIKAQQGNSFIMLVCFQKRIGGWKVDVNF